MNTDNIDSSAGDTENLIHGEDGPLCAEDDDAARIFTKIRFPSCRFVLMVMGFLGFVNVYCLRVNLSVALVAMVNDTEQPFQNMSHNNSDDICQSNESIGGTAFGSEKRHGEFNWDSHTQGIVLAAFFYGYILTQV